MHQAGIKTNKYKRKKANLTNKQTNKKTANRDGDDFADLSPSRRCMQNEQAAANPRTPSQNM
jgi:hypothetical protein